MGKRHHELNYKGETIEVSGYYSPSTPMSLEYPGDPEMFEIEHIHIDGIDKYYEDEELDEIEKLILENFYRDDWW